MFKKSRRKIVAAILTGLIVLMAVTLGMIYGFSYYQVAERNRGMLNLYVELFSLENPPGSDGGMNFETLTFYSVAFSAEGQVLTIDNRQSSIYSTDYLTELAKQLVENDKQHGTKKNLIYAVEVKADYTLVAFMDNTIVRESMTTLFRCTLIFGSAAIIILWILAVYLARKIVEPLELIYQKQRQFISDAGHELKTPLSSISANTEILEREIGKNRWLDNIQHENERMTTLVRQMLELARTENMEQKKEWVDFSCLVEEEMIVCESLVYEKGLLMNSQIQPQIMVYGSLTSLKQLMKILFDNALSYCDKDGEISVNLMEERGVARLKVINDGEPLSSAQQKEIFERFYRVDQARNSQDGHYGLGLSIAKAIVETHKGIISVACDDGKVIFTVNIPLEK